MRMKTPYDVPLSGDMFGRDKAYEQGFFAAIEYLEKRARRLAADGEGDFAAAAMMSASELRKFAEQTKPNWPERPESTEGDHGR